MYLQVFAMVFLVLILGSSLHESSILSLGNCVQFKNLQGQKNSVMITP